MLTSKIIENPQVGQGFLTHTVLCANGGKIETRKRDYCLDLDYQEMQLLFQHVLLKLQNPFNKKIFPKLS